jgi:hypothetical protein
MTKTLITAAFALFAAFGSLSAQAADASADARQVPVKNFDVYVDLPTGFVFMKLPSGWKFIEKVDGAAMAQLPAGVLTALLLSEDSGTGTQVAQAQVRSASR